VRVVAGAKAGRAHTASCRGSSPTRGAAGAKQEVDGGGTRVSHRSLAGSQLYGCEMGHAESVGEDRAALRRSVWNCRASCATILTQRAPMKCTGGHPEYEQRLPPGAKRNGAVRQAGRRIMVWPGSRWATSIWTTRLLRTPLRPNKKASRLLPQDPLVVASLANAYSQRVIITPRKQCSPGL